MSNYTDKVTTFIAHIYIEQGGQVKGRKNGEGLEEHVVRTAGEAFGVCEGTLLGARIPHAQLWTGQGPQFDHGILATLKESNIGDFMTWWCQDLRIAPTSKHPFSSTSLASCLLQLHTDLQNSRLMESNTLTDVSRNDSEGQLQEVETEQRGPWPSHIPYPTKAQSERNMNHAMEEDDYLSETSSRQDATSEHDRTDDDEP